VNIEANTGALIVYLFMIFGLVVGFQGVVGGFKIKKI
jgi:hypothetical protein